MQRSWQEHARLEATCRSQLLSEPMSEVERNCSSRVWRRASGGPSPCMCLAWCTSPSLEDYPAVGLVERFRRWLIPSWNMPELIANLSAVWTQALPPIRKQRTLHPPSAKRHANTTIPYEAASKLLVCSLLVFELGRPLSISTFWASSLNPSLNEISL